MTIQKTGPGAEKPGLLDHGNNLRVVLAPRITKADYRFAHKIFQPRLSLRHFLSGSVFRNGIQRNVVHGMSAQFKLLRELPQLRTGQDGLFRVAGGNIKSRGQAILGQQIGRTQVARVAIIHADGHETLRLRIRLYAQLVPGKAGRPWFRQAAAKTNTTSLTLYWFKRLNVRLDEELD